MDNLRDEIQKYLNTVGWSTVTLLVVEFETNRHDITMILAEMLAMQDVRIYDGEIVHV